MSFWRRPFAQRPGADVAVVEDFGAEAEGVEVKDGDLAYVVGKGGNDSGPSWQEASGAPVETESPLGYNVSSMTIIMLNVSKMIGTGIYSTRKSSTILSETGSVGLSMVYWAIGFFTSASGLAVYLEYASYFPNRSGSEVVYLEQAYPKPKFFFPTTFAFQSVLLSFSSGNALVMAEYLYAMGTSTATEWQEKGLAIGVYTFATLMCAANNKLAYRVSNAVALVKILTLAFIVVTGFVVLGGHTRVQDPTANFRNAFSGTATPYGLTNALYKIIFSYAGYENAFNVTGEVRNPIRKLKVNAYVALAITTLLYILANVAYFAAVSKQDLEDSAQVAASRFFAAVFGSGAAVRGLNFLIALAAFGNLLAVLIGQARLLRECGRQGVLPWPSFWASTWPFGTPLGPYFVKWAFTVILIVAPPTGDGWNFTTDLAIYPASVFTFAMAIGLYPLRHKRSRLGLPRSGFRAWDALVVFNIVYNLYLLVMPWYPPDGGPYAGDVSFWYATYAATGIGIIAACGIYYYAWTAIVPAIRGYRLRTAVITLENGAQSHELVKVPVGELGQWDATHDSVGRRVDSDTEPAEHVGPVMARRKEAGGAARTDDA